MKKNIVSTVAIVTALAGQLSGCALPETGEEIGSATQAVAGSTQTLDGNVASFGEAVASSGDWVIVGAYMDGSAAYAAGSVTFFHRGADGQLEQRQTLTPPELPYRAFFGFSVAIDGEWAFVGAHGTDARGTDSGRVYVYQRVGETWTYRQPLLPSDVGYRDIFGADVSVRGDVAIVGAPGYLSSPEAGTAYVFRLNGNGAWQQEQRLTPADGARGDRFGRTVRIEGSVAAVGAPNHDADETDAGAVYVFEGATWAPSSEHVGQEVGEQLGSGLDLDGDRIATSSALQDRAVVVLQRDGSGWSESAAFALPGSQADAGASPAIDLDGDRLAVGDPRRDGVGADAGAVDLFVLDANGTWTPELSALGDAANDDFGISVSLMDQALLVGALRSGAVEVLEVPSLPADDGAGEGGDALRVPGNIVYMGTFAQAVDLCKGMDNIASPADYQAVTTCSYTYYYSSNTPSPNNNNCDDGDHDEYWKGRTGASYFYNPWWTNQPAADGEHYMFSPPNGSFGAQSDNATGYFRCYQ